LHNPSNFPDVVFGISPRGGNSLSAGDLQGVPLVYDPSTGQYVSEQAMEEAMDDLISLERQAISVEEEAFRRKAGIQRT